jgi:RNA polymerase sigma-70 factor, ECF subfamily
MAQAPQGVTVLLGEVAKGDQQAVSKLIPLVYSELRRLAGRYMNRERANRTLQATALVHEAYLKLVQNPPVEWQSRTHFFGIAAQVMCQILIDYARGHGREKRGGGQGVVSLEDSLVLSPEKSSEYLMSAESLQRLTKLDPRQGRIIELRFFGGLTVEDTAQVLGISPKTVKREWSMAKAWLHADLGQGHGNPTAKVGEN